MKVLMFYRPKSEFAHGAEMYVKEFERRSSKTIDIIDIDSREGIQQANLYGVLDHPTFVAVADDGHFLQAWSGKPLPVMNELQAFADTKK